MKRFAALLGRYTFSNPDTLIGADGESVVTYLFDENGAFMPYAVTDAEIEDARKNPNRIVNGPICSAWRQKPIPES
jgi:hypothetical protein